MESAETSSINSNNTGNNIMSTPKDMREAKVKPANPLPRERSELAILSTEVQFTINYRIQRSNLPQHLILSDETIKLHSLIVQAQDRLKASLRSDYERQRADILAKRESNGSK